MNSIEDAVKLFEDGYVRSQAVFAAFSEKLGLPKKQATLANEHRILRFDAAFSGGVDAVFRCGYREYVSRRCFSEIRRRYEGV